MDNKYNNRCIACFTELTGGKCPNCKGINKENCTPLALPQRTILRGDYFLSRTVGKGGFGITYKAFNVRTNEMVAIKEFFPPYGSRLPDGSVSVPYENKLSHAKGMKRVMEEAKRLAELKAVSSIINVYDFFTHNQTAYIVMEYVRGDSFSEYLKKHRGKLSISDCISVLVPVFNALSTLHAAGITHRDISPDNILITTTDAKIIDYGSASRLSNHIDISVKRHFAPPEQYGRGKQDSRADIYSLAATIYLAITKHLPEEAIKRINKDNLVPPSKWAKLSKEQESALLKALSISPKDRYDDVRDLLRDLKL